MTPGTVVRVTGARRFTGTIKAATDIMLVIEHGKGLSAILRRDPASSTAPVQWRIAGLPVEVHAKAGDFNTRLEALVERVSKILYARTFDGVHWFINDADGHVVRPDAFDSEAAARDWCARFRPNCEVITKRYDGVQE